MLVKDYVDQLIQNRPYKYAYKQTLIRDIKKLGIWDFELEQVTSSHIRDVVDSQTNHNSRRRLYITARSVFKDINKCQDLPVLESISRIYQFPAQDQLDFLINKSKYRLQLFLLRSFAVKWLIPLLTISVAYQWRSMWGLIGFPPVSWSAFLNREILNYLIGGLRVGEACAVTPSKLEGNYLRVDEARLLQ